MSTDALALARVARYEAAYARAAGAGEAIAFAYARTALVAILRAAGIAAGDEVVLSPLTCKVVPLALLSAGVRPVYADIARDTLNLDAGRAREAIGSRTRAVLFQHTYGLSGGAAEVAGVAAERNVPLIEDCAQCLARSGDGAAGRLGRAAIFSNNPGKPLPSGSGGIAITDDERLAERVRAVRDALPERSGATLLALRAENLARNRLPPSLYWTAYALHRRLRNGSEQGAVQEEIEAEVSRVAYGIGASEASEGERWLDRLERVRRHRAVCCAEYASALDALRTAAAAVTHEGSPLYYFPVFVERKQDLLRRARAKRIELIAWPIRTPIYPVEREADLPRYGYQPGSCPIAEDVAQKLVGLPTDLNVGAAHRAAILELLRS